jgi:hypothetical protein
MDPILEKLLKDFIQKSAKLSDYLLDKSNRNEVEDDFISSFEQFVDKLIEMKF